MTSIAPHNFHIPVMGIGFTIDTPVKVAHFGISSVISLVDDVLLEKMRKHYCLQNEISYIEISEKDEDFRANRVTAYLNLIDELVTKNFNRLKRLPLEKNNDLTKYFDLLPDNSDLKSKFFKLFNESDLIKRDHKLKLIKEQMTKGSIDVNVMSKVDGEQYTKSGQKMSYEYRRAHACLRGFAKSTLNSSIVLSAGMNPYLYSYFEELPEFLPDEKGILRKKVTLKVSDFRSALVQGKMLAKKGVWISEYRIESGLNCGGHAFATNGLLLGPILQEFKDKKDQLFNEVFPIYLNTISTKKCIIKEDSLQQKFTAQGGVGNADEHNFILKYYNVEGVGWGTPFLLVPEAVNVDNNTLDLLAKAEEKDLYLSGVSPLGVHFNNLRNSSFEQEKERKIHKNRPGSACPRKGLAFNTEYTDKPICTASRQYQNLKIKDLQSQNLSTDVLNSQIKKVTDKTCLCIGLGTSALLVNELDNKVEGNAVEVCPGPNLAYFSKTSSLKEMVDHIYGKINILSKKPRPHMFIKELGMYVDYLKEELLGIKETFSQNEVRNIETFKSNLLIGIDYYKNLFSKHVHSSFISKKQLSDQLKEFEQTIKNIGQLQTA